MSDVKKEPMKPEVFKVTGFEIIGNMVGRLNQLMASGINPVVTIREEDNDRSRAQNRLMHRWFSDIAKTTGNGVIYEAGRCKMTYFLPLLAGSDNEEAVMAHYVATEIYKKVGYEKFCKVIGSSVIGTTRYLSVKQFEEALNNMAEGERLNNLTDPSRLRG